MELGSAGSSSNSSSSSSSDSLNGLKFGKKIYFENANGGPGGGGASSASVSATGGKPPPAPSKKGKGGLSPGGQPPRCQVEGCKLDLSDAKAYYSRHKVCGLHSKSPKVIIAGIEQRFCQQCSRFHLLPEFDQGKRSCRRRLAGHNERRRKPPPGSIMSARFGSLSSPFLENSGRSGSFLLDFSKYPAHASTDSWPNTRTSSERSLGNEQTIVGKFPPSTWHCNHPENSPSEILVQGSTARTSYSDIPLGECFTGFSTCSRALSLLSNQSMGSRERFSSLGYVNANGTAAPMVQSLGSHCDSIDGFSSPLWGGFKGSECNSSSHDLPPDLGLGQISQPARSHYAEDLDIAQQNERDYLVLEHSRGYDSSVQNMHWSL